MTSQRQNRFILRARVVLPVSRPAIDNGAVLVSGDRIAAVGAAGEIDAPAGTPVEDLGEVILMPGLINAHCHLEYTGMAGLVPPGDSFTDWLRRIIRLKATWTVEQFHASWLDGARMLVDSGTTTVADIVSVTSLLPDVWQGSSARVFSFLEMTGLLGGASAGEIARETVQLAERLNDEGGDTGLSPHSLYSTAKGLAALASITAVEKGLRSTMHLAESDEEFEMFARADGSLHDWLKDVGREMDDCGGRSPVAVAAECGALGRGLLAAHVNRLGEGDAGRLKASGASVVHCPGSHAFFGHTPFPYDELDAAGVNICLGTDSLASVKGEGNETPRLNMFAEMRGFAAAFPGARPERIVRMATENGARALGLGGSLGALRPGDAYADCIAVPHSAAIEEAGEAVVHFAGAPERVMISGRWTERNSATDRRNLDG